MARKLVESLFDTLTRPPPPLRERVGIRVKKIYQKNFIGKWSEMARKLVNSLFDTLLPPTWHLSPSSKPEF